MGFYSSVVFPRILDWTMRSPEMSEQRKIVLADVKGETFEIGFGTGLNLRYYPETVKKVTTADVNPSMRKIAQRRVDASPIEVEHHVISGDSLPFDDASFDTLVCTWTLCSIARVEDALDEFNRVLRKDGKFLFIEHGLSNEPKVQKWQNRLNPFWKKIGDGCNLNRNHRELIQDHRFAFDKLDNFYLPKAPHWAGYLYRGIARKAA